MSEQPSSGRERLHELLADRAVFGPDIEVEQELRELLNLNPDVDAEELDRLATLLDVTVCAAYLPPLPPALAARVRSEASNPVPTTPHGFFGTRFQKRELLAWLTATTSLLIAVFLWANRNTDDLNVTPIVDSGPIAKQNPDLVPVVMKGGPTLAEQRDELLTSSEGLLHIRLGETSDPTEPQVSGDIVWSHTQQRGFLRLQGLPSNDPAKSQYQLWLVEATPMRTETVNGGVFDVEQSARQLIVPIRAEHFVHQPNMFVVSIEPPGGSLDLTVSGYPLVAKVGNESQ